MAPSSPAQPNPAQPSPASSPSLATLRLVVLASAASLLLLLAVLWLLGQGFTRVATSWMAIPLILGLATIVLVPAVGSTVRPLPHGVSTTDARRISAGVLRTVTFLRLGLAEAPALVGLAASVVTGSLVPYVVGLAFAVPLLLVRAYPRTSVVDALRHRLESGGVTSDL